MMLEKNMENKEEEDATRLQDFSKQNWQNCPKNTERIDFVSFWNEKVVFQ
ncbi:hypothetical protein HYC85_023615 [Camellia sinensis]|uniref:Uncharacterized protein n=1 Tax=Camellia sinensis TaxID=4442 RepID=A0A7J7GIY1_CAMSI|nr:hypothetical protein HYC85_023615 [Camellia sinensis]